MLSNSVLEIWPYAMPSAPSTSWAAKPIAMKMSKVVGSTSSCAKILVLQPCFAARCAERAAVPQVAVAARFSTWLEFAAVRT